MHIGSSTTGPFITAAQSREMPLRCQEILGIFSRPAVPRVTDFLSCGTVTVEPGLQPFLLPAEGQRQHEQDPRFPGRQVVAKNAAHLLHRRSAARSPINRDD